MMMMMVVVMVLIIENCQMVHLMPKTNKFGDDGVNYIHSSSIIG